MSVMRLVNATALAIAAIGVLIQFLTGVPGFPTIPPGPIILTVAAIAVITLGKRWRWVISLGIIVPLMIIIGGIVDGRSWARIADPGTFGPFIGTALQWVAMPIALIAGVLALLDSRTASTR